MRTFLACLWSFALTVPVAYFGFGGVFRDSVLIKLSGALIYAFAGLTIPFVAWLSARAYLKWFENQQPEPT